MKKFCAFVLYFISLQAFSQNGGVGINPNGAPPDASAILDLSTQTKGLLMPRLTAAQRDAIANPASGLVIYNTDCSVFNYNAGTPGAPNWATITASNVLVASLNISANPVGAICAGTSVTFTATPANGINSPGYQWQVNGQNMGTNSSTYTTTALNNGDVVTCVLSTSAPCVSGSPATSNALTMVVNANPVITGTSPASFCNGSIVTLSATANTGTINWYANSTGGSSLLSGASYSIPGLTSTTTYYTDATLNSCTSPSRTAVTATFYPNTPSQPAAISGVIVVAKNDTATYSISAVANAATYTWTVGAGVITSGQGTTSILVTWGDSSANGSVAVNASNACGTSAAQQINVGIEEQVFAYTGSQQTFTVPAGVTLITINAYGAQGGSESSNIGGLGGLATGTLNVTPGDTMYIYAGGQGIQPTGGFNGGGNAIGGAGGGGGGSDVRLGGTDLASRIIIGGGGGGVSGTSWNCTGGYGGGTNGQNGQGGAGGTGSAYDGQGGTQGNGGEGETAYHYNGSAENGSFGQGGEGGYANGSGGGGGGGYYGGGGSDAGSAGGGSGYIGGVNGGSMQNGVQAGNGVVVISW